MTMTMMDRLEESNAPSRDHPPLNGEAITAVLAEHALSYRLAQIPADIRHLARLCILDLIGVAIAGANEAPVRMLIEDAEEQGGRPAASLIGHSRRVSTQQAALINGTAGHALDYDDCNLTLTGHVTAVVLPPLLALAEGGDYSGADLLTAFIAGYETGCRVGKLVEPGHYDRGFHATATVGSFAAAAGAARLLQLTEGETRRALGIAGTQAAGLKAMFGTMCKPLHAGNAARNAVVAVSLARRGFTSREDVLECGQGFAATQSPDFLPELALGVPPNGYHLRDNLFKFHAACYGVHPVIECGRQLRRERTFRPEDIRGVSATVGAVNDSTCNIKAPRTPAEAKFSMRLTTALGLIGIDTGGLDSYDEAVILRPDVVALRDKVDIRLADMPITQARMIVEMAGGERMETFADCGLPPADLDDLERRLEEKFHALVTPILGEERSRRIVGLISTLERLGSVAELTRACAN